MARREIRIPRRGIEDSVEEIEIEEWFVREGDVVQEGAILCTVDTSKARLEIEAPITGSIVSICVKQGVGIPAKEVTSDGMHVNTIIAIMESDAPVSSSLSVVVHKEEQQVFLQKNVSQPLASKMRITGGAAKKMQALAGRLGLTYENVLTNIRTMEKMLGADRINEDMVDGYEKRTFGPYESENEKEDIIENHMSVVSEKQEAEVLTVYPARVRAKEKGIDLSLIKGTGPREVITVGDIEAVASARTSVPTGSVIRARAINASVDSDPNFEPANMLRKTIAWNLSRGSVIPTAASKKTVVGLGQLFTFKRWHADRFLDVYGVPYMITFPIACAVVQILKQTAFRKLNACAVAPHGAYTGVGYHSDINLGIPFNNDGLKIAVVKGLQEKSYQGIASALFEALTEARKGKQEFLSDWTFIVNNVGANGDDEGNSILAGNITAMLNIGAIAEDTGKATLQVFFDHRVFDGDLASAFRNAVHAELLNVILPELAQSLY